MHHMHEEHPHKVLPYLAACLVAMLLLAVTAASPEQTWDKVWAYGRQGNQQFSSFVAFVIPGEKKTGPQVAGDYTTVDQSLQSWWETPWDPLYSWLAGK